MENEEAKATELDHGTYLTLKSIYEELRVTNRNHIIGFIVGFFIVGFITQAITAPTDAGAARAGLIMWIYIVIFLIIYLIEMKKRKSILKKYAKKLNVTQKELKILYKKAAE